MSTQTFNPQTNTRPVPQRVRNFIMLLRIRRNISADSGEEKTIPEIMRRMLRKEKMVEPIEKQNTEV